MTKYRPTITKDSLQTLTNDIETRNAWQSLAYSPLGAVVSLPSEYL